MMDLSTDALLKDLLAERAIRKVKHAYLAASDRFDLDAVLATMTDDVVWDGGAALGRHQGKEAVGGLVKFVGGITRFTAHLVTNEMIEVNGDRATGKWWMIVPSTVEIEGQKIAQWLFAYSETSFVQQNGNWLISEIKLDPRAMGPHSAGWA